MQQTRSSFLAAAAVLMVAAAPGALVVDGGGNWQGRATRVISAGKAQRSEPQRNQSTPSSPEQRAAWLQVRSHRAARRRYGGLGWPVAHDRRMARKRRGQAKARRAGRG